MQHMGLLFDCSFKGPSRGGDFAFGGVTYRHKTRNYWLFPSKPQIPDCQAAALCTSLNSASAHSATGTKPQIKNYFSKPHTKKAVGVTLTQPTKTRAHAHKYLTPTAEPGWPQLCRSPNVAPDDPGEAPLEPEVVLFGFERALPGRRAQRGTVSLASIPDKSRQLRAEGG